MKVLNVRKIGVVLKSSTKKNFLGDDVTQVKDEPIYLVNTKFSDANFGFVVNRAGMVLTCTAGFNMPNEEVRRYAAEAKKVMDEGKIGELVLEFTI